ncbi:heme exporter protein CcmD [Roseibium sp.]|uniref:heme exporter protein CcmD n=1 Tax=Roseibium sp. TaxID=1936156 RepID=UPI003A97A6C3
MDLGPHAGFIIASYAVCMTVVIGLIVWVRVDKARLDAALEDLAAQGHARASRASRKTDQS